MIPVGDADRHLLDLIAVGVPLHSYQSLLRRAVAISSAARIGVYDCVYVALAERENCDLVTSDSELITALGKMFPFIKSLGSIP